MDHGTGPRSPSNMLDTDFSVDTLMDEIDGGGWLDTTRPEGVPAAQLRTLNTVGGRGSEGGLRSDPLPKANRTPIE